MASGHTKYEGREELTFAPVDKDDPRGPITVYAGTGLYDALVTDPDYELVKGDPGEGTREAPARTKPETGPKTDPNPGDDPTLERGKAESKSDLVKLDRADLNSKAADVGVKAAEAMPNKGDVADAIIDAQKAIHGPATG